MGKRLIGAGFALTVGLVLTGCSSSSTATTTVTTSASSASSATTGGTTSATTGGATAQAVAAVFVRAVQSGSLSTFCAYAVPSQVATCRKDVTEATGAETFQGIALGTVTVQGDKAVVALTGTICPTGTSSSTQAKNTQSQNSQTQTTQKSTCISNTDPNVASKDNQTFAEAYAGATDTTNQNSSPFVTALVRKDGRWYATGF